MRKASANLFLALLRIFSALAADNTNELQTFVIASDAQPNLHWAVELDCDSAVKLSPNKKAISPITLDDGICRALCSQFKEKDMSKKALAQAFAAHNALDCRFAYFDALYIPTSICVGNEGNYLFTISEPSNIKRLLLVSSRVEAFWNMRLDVASREGGCLNGTTLLYNYVKIEKDEAKKDEAKEADNELLMSLGSTGGKYLCAKDWSGSSFDTARYSPGVLNRIDELDFLAVNITKAISVDVPTMKVPFIVQLNSRDCFGSMNPLRPEGGLILYFEKYLSDLETWL